MFCLFKKSYVTSTKHIHFACRLVERDRYTRYFKPRQKIMECSGFDQTQEWDTARRRVPLWFMIIRLWNWQRRENIFVFVFFKSRKIYFFLYHRVLRLFELGRFSFSSEVLKLLFLFLWLLSIQASKVLSALLRYAFHYVLRFFCHFIFLVANSSSNYLNEMVEILSCIVFNMLIRCFSKLVPEAVFASCFSIKFYPDTSFSLFC